MSKFWEVKAAAAAPKVGDVYIYGAVTSYKWDDSDVTAKSFKDDLEALGDINMLNVYINSPGGSVFQGQAIYTILRRYAQKGVAVSVHVDGLAASIASVIAMAGGTVTMPRNAMMMVHNPWTYAYGNAGELRKAANDLDKIRLSMIEAYLDKAAAKLSRDKLTELMDAESWLTAQECCDYGLCDVLEAENSVAACVDPEVMAKYRNTPAPLREAAKSGGSPARLTGASIPAKPPVGQHIPPVNPDLEERNAILAEANRVHTMLGGR